MSFLSVSENIRVIEENIQKLKEQIVAINLEIVRAEGSLQVFKQIKSFGVEHIPIPSPKDEVVNTEVLSDVD